MVPRVSDKNVCAIAGTRYNKRFAENSGRSERGNLSCADNNFSNVTVACVSHKHIRCVGGARHTSGRPEKCVHAITVSRTTRASTGQGAHRLRGHSDLKDCMRAGVGDKNNTAFIISGYAPRITQSRGACYKCHVITGPKVGNFVNSVVLAIYDKGYGLRCIHCNATRRSE